ncbi:hypothetical protein ANO11243_061870 [Dothideomycetidae sp. 11243]|nr:hypothetical protein ANO11243_061870 [fungal sp. No.11243]
MNPAKSRHLATTIVLDFTAPGVKIGTTGTFCSVFSDDAHAVGMTSKSSPVGCGRDIDAAASSLGRFLGFQPVRLGLVVEPTSKAVRLQYCGRKKFQKEEGRRETGSSLVPISIMF